MSDLLPLVVAAMFCLLAIGQMWSWKLLRELGEVCFDTNCNSARAHFELQELKARIAELESQMIRRDDVRKRIREKIAELKPLPYRIEDDE